jgi:hypothetical protein
MRRKPEVSGKRIKCLIWDLDLTLWNGILLERDPVQPRPEAVRVLDLLDSRGVLHSIVSRNDAPLALQKLQELGIADYFLHPQIGWGASTSRSIQLPSSMTIRSSAPRSRRLVPACSALTPPSSNVCRSAPSSRSRRSRRRRGSAGSSIAPKSSVGA